MDNIWAFREIYDRARAIKLEQDEYCKKAKNGHRAGLGSFPEELQYEALVDVLRGRVKVHVHFYEPVDLAGIVREREVLDSHSGSGSDSMHLPAHQ